MPDLYTEVTRYFNGTALTTSPTTDVTRSPFGLPMIEPVAVDVPEAMTLEGNKLRAGNPVVGALRITQYIKLDYSGSSTNPDVAFRFLADDWEACGVSFNPYSSSGATVEFRVDRKDASNATVSRVIDVRVAQHSSITAADSPTSPGMYMYGGKDSWQAIYPLVMYAPVGVWRDREATTVTEANVSTGGNNFAYTNLLRRAPVRFLVNSVAGSVASVTIASGATTLATWTHDTAFATADYVDFGYTTANDFDHDADSSVAVGDWAYIPIGTGNLTLTTNASSASISMLYKATYNSW